MNKELIEKRLNELEAMEQQIVQTIQKSQAEIQRLQADLSAISGAKQDCQYWTAKIEESENAHIAVQEKFEKICC